MQPIILGIILGAAAGLINFTLLVKIAKNVEGMEPRRAGILVMTSYFGRIGLYAAVIILSVLSERINPLATGGGLLAVALFFTLRYTLTGKQ